MVELVLRRITVLVVPICLILALSERPAAAKPLLIGPFMITLHDGSSTLSNSSVVTSGPEVTAGDGTAIGNYLHPGESIDVGSSSVPGSSSILLDILGGGSPIGQPPDFSGTTTYSNPGGNYSFTGLQFNTPGAIASVTASSPDSTVTGLGGLGLTWTDNSISLSLGGVGVLNSGTNLGELLLTVNVVDTGTNNTGTTNTNSLIGTDQVIDPIPEPASLTLIGTGVAAAALRRRRKSGAA